MTIDGIHHVTAIASDPQRNLDFYVGLLGLRLVKRTINFDDPETYHFYFGDAIGTPGTILTFFPWPAAYRGARGAGEVESTAFSIPPESVGYWLERLKEYHVSAERMPERFGEEVIRLLDTDGMLLELIASKSSDEVQPWIEGPVPAEHSIRGLHGVIWIPETILFLLNMRRKQVLAGPVFVAVSGQILPVIAINAIEIERFDNHHACRG